MDSFEDWTLLQGYEEDGWTILEFWRLANTKDFMQDIVIEKVSEIFCIYVNTVHCFVIFVFCLYIYYCTYLNLGFYSSYIFMEFERSCGSKRYSLS